MINWTIVLILTIIFGLLVFYNRCRGDKMKQEINIKQANKILKQLLELAEMYGKAKKKVEENHKRREDEKEENDNLGL